MYKENRGLTNVAKFVKPRFEDEIKSFNAIANKVFADISQQDIRRNLITQMITDLKKKYTTKAVQDLKLNMWKTLQGTESWNAETMKMIERTIKKQEIPKLKQTIIELLSERPVDTPIIIMQNNIGMLITGEHTLLACRLLNIEPKVVMI